MNIGIVGGGINGLCCAWELAKNKHQVTLYERDHIMQATSSASSKLLHGGIRYLENWQFRLVRESLHERDAWLIIAPSLAKPLPVIYPKYQQSKRSRFKLNLGFGLYNLLSGHSPMPPSKWLNAQEVQTKIPGLQTKALQGGYLYYDAQMDDYQLGQWVAEQCKDLGVQIHEQTPVQSVTVEGSLTFANNSNKKKFDRILNITGPWAEQLLINSNIASKHHLDLIRGSHMVIDTPCSHALILEVPNETRIFFVLPWYNKTLIGTTETRQKLDEPIACSDTEKQYLIKAYNHYFNTKLTDSDTIETFTGIRPLLNTNTNPGKASREYAIQKNKNLITIFGGKWTTSRALAKKVSKMISS